MDLTNSQLIESVFKHFVQHANLQIILISQKIGFVRLSLKNNQTFQKILNTLTFLINKKNIEPVCVGLSIWNTRHISTLETFRSSKKQKKSPQFQQMILRHLTSEITQELSFKLFQYQSKLSRIATSYIYLKTLLIIIKKTNVQFSKETIQHLSNSLLLIHTNNDTLQWELAEEDQKLLNISRTNSLLKKVVILLCENNFEEISNNLLNLFKNEKHDKYLISDLLSMLKFQPFNNNEIEKILLFLKKLEENCLNIFQTDERMYEDIVSVILSNSIPMKRKTKRKKPIIQNGMIK
ncbi:transient receptor potential cation channel subfamily m member [Anaeramoeba flamelloides]|uniref:Transient receptor potential cation channel subfamily m member n=1 Tax=Anaeramoeba flamelloides TaxID=1746091 RepID=A0AAV7Z2Y9_9EUKA|nr:transient receptor potential cation channel subfamily m member [Anaeramoeba flamelloides]